MTAQTVHSGLRTVPCLRLVTLGCTRVHIVTSVRGPEGEVYPPRVLRPRTTLA